MHDQDLPLPYIKVYIVHLLLVSAIGLWQCWSPALRDLIEQIKPSTQSGTYSIGLIRCTHIHNEFLLGSIF